MNDLFGQVIVDAPKEAVKGYARPPGTGPVGETCGTCENACYTGSGSNKRFFTALELTSA